MKDFEAKIRECQLMCKHLNIPVAKDIDFSINTRAKSRWGQARYNKSTNSYSINISNRLLADDVPDYGLLSTILHELLHTCPGCMNHGAKWKMYAKQVSDAYGYSIATTDSAANKGVKEEPKEIKYKYLIRCYNCGKTYGYHRKSATVQLIEAKPTTHGCRCGRCHSRNLHLV